MFSTTPYCMPNDCFYYQVPSKYTTILPQREQQPQPQCVTPPMPCERTYQPWTNYPCQHERCQLPCPNWTQFNNTTLTTTSCRPCCEAEWYTLKNPCRWYENGCRGIWLCFDLHEYKTEEIQVTLNRTERCIIVEANQENKEQGISRKYCRRWNLPEYTNKVDLTKCEFRSWCSPYDCYCYVECVFPRMTPEETHNWPTPTLPYQAWQHCMKSTNCHPSWHNPNYCWENNNCCNNNWTNCYTTNCCLPPTTQDNCRPVNCKTC